MASRGSQYESIINCTNLSIQQLLIINLIRGVTLSVCLLISTFIMGLLVLYKAYSSVLQRLFLYMMVASLLRQLSMLGTIEHQWQYSGQDEVCVVVGFLYNWASVTVFIFASGKIVYLLFLVYRLVKRNPFPGLTHSKWKRRTIELLYVVLPVLISFAYAWGPYVDHKYGLAGPWCWIQSVDENCTNIGLRDQLVYDFAFYEGAGIIGVVLFVSIVVVYCKLASTLRDAQILLKKALILVTFLLLFVAVFTYPLFVRVYTGLTGKYVNFGMWVVHALTLPLCQLIFPCGFFICLYSLRTLHWRCLKQAVAEWGCCDVCFKSRSTQWIEQATIPISTRVTQPSTTFFRVPFTEGFTDVGADVKSPLLSNLNETSGYNSIGTDGKSVS